MGYVFPPLPPFHIPYPPLPKPPQASPSLPYHISQHQPKPPAHQLTPPPSPPIDASKVPPSRFQKRKGSIYAVPSSRDGHVDSNYNTKFHEKHKELWKSDASTSNKDSISKE